MIVNKAPISDDIQTQLEEIFKDNPVSPNELGDYMRQYRMLMTYYRCAIKEVVTKFEVLEDCHHGNQ